MFKMNGPCGMYAISPHYEYPKIIEKPKCMYDMQNVYAANNCPRFMQNTDAVLHTFNEDNDLSKLEERQKRLISQLEDLSTKLRQIKQQMTTVPSVLDIASYDADATSTPAINSELKAGAVLDVVITASMKTKLIALKILSCWLSKWYRTSMVHHMHSSVVQPLSMLKVGNLQSLKFNESRGQQQVILTVIRKDVGDDPQLMVSPSRQHTAICGEVNVLRYLTSLLLPSLYFHDPVKQTEVDDWLDMAHFSILHGIDQKRQITLRTLDSHLEKHQFLVGDNLSVADVGMLGAILQIQSVNKLPSSLKRWLTTCQRDPGISSVFEALSVVVS